MCLVSFAMLFYNPVSIKGFPILLAFVFGLNLGVILTYLYVSSAEITSSLVDPSENVDREIEVLDLDHSDEIKLHESKQNKTRNNLLPNASLQKENTCQKKISLEKVNLKTM